MKQAVFIPKDPENCKVGQKAGSFYRIKNEEQGNERKANTCPRVAAPTPNANYSHKIIFWLWTRCSRLLVKISTETVSELLHGQSTLVHKTFNTSVMHNHCK